MDEDSRRRLAPLWQAKTTIADLPTGRTHPLAIQEGLPDPLPIPVQQAGPTKLPPHPTAVLVVANRFGVDGLLPALVTGCAVHAVIDLVGASLWDLHSAVWRPARLVIQFDG